MSRVPLVPEADRRARYEVVFREAYEPLQRYVRRRVAPDQADDIVAEALTVAWRRLDDVPGDGMAVAWCIGVARRLLANQRRGDARRGRLAERLRHEAGRSLPAPHTGGVAASAIGDEAGGDDDLDRALAQMSADERELLHLWAWDGFAPREIAVVLGVSANAVSIRLHRAKLRLGELLGRKDPEAAGHSWVGRTEEAR